jgi:hypothetical protein
MPLAFKKNTVRSQMPHYSADFVCRKSRVDRQVEIVQPELGFIVAGSHVNMRRLIAFV